MDTLVESFCKLRIQCDTPPPQITKNTLAKAVKHLYTENIKLKNEIQILRNLLSVKEPKIPHWVS